MEYISVREAAERWAVSERRVHKLLEEGRIRGAARLGRAWMIPEDAEKPGDPRLAEKRTIAESVFEGELERAFKAGLSPFPRSDPYMVLSTISDEKLRLLPESVLAYLRGDFEHIKRCYRQVEDDDAIKLAASAIAIPAAIKTGDYPFYIEVENWLKDVIKAGFGPGVTALAQHSLATGYLGASAADMIAEWIKTGDFADLLPILRYEANIRRADYFRCMKEYGSMLYIAQTTLSLYGIVCSVKETTIAEIMLLLRCAIACNYLGRMDEAKRWLTEAMDITLPHGFITPFVDTFSFLGGLTEQLMNKEYPERYDAFVEQIGNTSKNWVIFHNRFTKDNMTCLLTFQEYEIAMLAVRKVSRAKIAEQLHYSEGWVDKTLKRIYEKLLIKSRDELAAYIIL